MNDLDRKLDAFLSERFDTQINILADAYNAQLDAEGVQLSNADRVGPEKREKLKGLLKHYAKSPKPFTQCVADNRKRFGPKAEGVCAVLKDIIRGTTKWRGKDNPKDKGSAGIKGLSEEANDFDWGLYNFLFKLSEKPGQLEGLLDLAAVLDEGEKSTMELYPMEQGPLPLADADTKFLKELHTHHSSRLKLATKYATLADAHPDVSGFANDAVSESTRQITRINRMLKTGSPYG